MFEVDETGKEGPRHQSKYIFPTASNLNRCSSHPGRHPAVQIGFGRKVLHVLNEFHTPWGALVTVESCTKLGDVDVRDLPSSGSTNEDEDDSHF